jgi:hypothetical protein
MKILIFSTFPYAGIPNVESRRLLIHNFQAERRHSEKHLGSATPGGELESRRYRQMALEGANNTHRNFQTDFQVQCQESFLTLNAPEGSRIPSDSLYWITELAWDSFKTIGICVLPGLAIIVRAISASASSDIGVNGKF